MRRVLQATGILAASSVVNLVLGLVSIRVLALALGPAGVGLYSLQQSALALFALLFGMGLGPGIVRLATEEEPDDRAGLAEVERAAWWLTILLWLVGGVFVLLLSEGLSTWMLGGVDRTHDMRTLAFALFFTMAAEVPINLLNALHRIQALALARVLSRAAAVLLLVVFAWWRGEDGLATALLLGAAATWLTYQLLWFRDRARPRGVSPTDEGCYARRRALLTFGLPYSLSAISGAGVQAALPILVMHMLGQVEVGHYRAALALSTTVLLFLLQAMSQEFYPRLARMRETGQLIEAINQQLRMVLLLATPLILGAITLAPELIRLLFSPDFAPAAEVLRWQMAGEVLKASSWCFSFGVLTRCGSQIYFFSELAGGMSLLLATAVGISWVGLPGAGMAYAASYAFFLVLQWGILRRQEGFVLSLENRLLLGLLVPANVALVLLGQAGPPGLVLPVGGLMTLVAAVFGLRALRGGTARDGASPDPPG